MVFSDIYSKCILQKCLKVEKEALSVCLFQSSCASLYDDMVSVSVTLGINICVSYAILCALSVIATAGICFNLHIMKNRHTSKELTSLVLGKEGR